jgi:hypothetical protein
MLTEQEQYVPRLTLLEFAAQKPLFTALPAVPYLDLDPGCDIGIASAHHGNGRASEEGPGGQDAQATT